MESLAEWGRRILWGLKLGALMVLAGLPLVLGYILYMDPSGLTYFVVGEIEVVGLERVEKDRLEESIRNGLPKNILRVDLQDVRRKLESDPWVERAVVRRRLPNRLQVALTERRPAAVARIAQSLVLIDESGVVLADHDPSVSLPDRPIVLGLTDTRLGAPASDNQQRMERYWQVLEALQGEAMDYAATISEIDVANTERVAVVPSDKPVPVFLGDRDFMERYRIFRSQLDLYDQFKKQHGSIRSVDVTSGDRIIFRKGKEEPLA